MILANGSWNAKKYAGDNITVDEILAGIDRNSTIHDYLKRDVVYIERPDDRVEVDTLNNEIRRSASMTVGTVYTLSDPKSRDRCEFRYYENVYNLPNNSKTYEPNTIEVFDYSLATPLSWDNKEKMAFLLLSPRCADSPFADEVRVSYKIKDTAIIAARTNKVNRELTMLHSAIYREAEENPDMLVRKAQGITINREKIAVDFNDIDEVVNGLIDMSRKYPQDFKIAFESSESSAMGLIADALRQGVLKYTVEGIDIVASLNGKELCRFPKQYDPTLGIFEYMTDHNLEFFLKEMTESLIEINASKKINRTIKKK